MLRKIKTKIKKIRYAICGEPKWKGAQTDSPIAYAFTWDGEDYYCFENPFNMPWQRAYVAMAYYEELNMRITKDFLLEILFVMKEEINKPKPGITEVVKYINLLEERTKYVVEPETLLKLASVYYFTLDENPFFYDLIFNQKKIANWRKARTLDFFLQLPLRELAPLLTLPRRNFTSLFSRSNSEKHKNDRRNVRGFIARELQRIEAERIAISEEQPNRAFIERFGILSYCELKKQLLERYQKLKQKK
jgi:hypothetical protein